MTPGIKQAELEPKLNGLAQQEQQDVDQRAVARPARASARGEPAADRGARSCGSAGCAGSPTRSSRPRRRRTRRRRAPSSPSRRSAARERRGVGRPLPDARRCVLSEQGMHGRRAVPQLAVRHERRSRRARATSPRSSTGCTAPRRASAARARPARHRHRVDDRAAAGPRPLAVEDNKVVATTDLHSRSPSRTRATTSREASR